MCSGLPLYNHQILLCVWKLTCISGLCPTLTTSRSSSHGDKRIRESPPSHNPEITEYLYTFIFSSLCRHFPLWWEEFAVSVPVGGKMPHSSRKYSFICGRLNSPLPNYHVTWNKLRISVVCVMGVGDSGSLQSLLGGSTNLSLTAPGVQRCQSGPVHQQPEGCPHFLN